LEVLDMSRRNRCTRIATALLLIAPLAALGCGRKQPRGASAQQPRPVAVAPAPIEPAPAVEPEPVVVEVAEPEPPIIAEPDEPVNLLAAANEAAARGDCATALQYVRRFRIDQPDNLMLRIREAGLSNECGQPQRAIDLLIDLDASARAMEPVAAALADAYLLMNRPGKAAMSWELRYIVDETAWDAAVHAATAWLEADAYGTAQWWFEQARKAAPDSPEVEMLATFFEPDED
jgi:predicted Zn-dependent protease